MHFTEMVTRANREGWFLLNCFQIAGMFRVNLQYRQPSGTTTNYFSEYAEGDTPEAALAAAWERASKQTKVLKTHQRTMPETAPSRLPKTVAMQEKRIEAAMDRLWMALKAKNGSRS